MYFVITKDVDGTFVEPCDDLKQYEEDVSDAKILAALEFPPPGLVEHELRRLQTALDVIRAVEDLAPESETPVQDLLVRAVQLGFQLGRSGKVDGMLLVHCDE